MLTKICSRLPSGGEQQFEPERAKREIRKGGGEADRFSSTFDLLNTSSERLRESHLWCEPPRR